MAKGHQIVPATVIGPDACSPLDQRTLALRRVFIIGTLITVRGVA